MIDDNTKRTFRTEVWDYYHAHGRDELPWRSVTEDRQLDVYHVVVSELMLQQTQVGRVIPKYHQFLEQFPTVQDLAIASMGDVLRAWTGLGYNRRAKFLWQTARQVVQEYGGVFPQQLEALVQLPGIGRNTAGAILAYAYNQPVVFVETNIRTVFIHHFFRDQSDVTDKIILELVAETLDREHPREWYWALMDYGAYLKQLVGNLSRLSQTYTKQSTFQGSKRQIRGKILQQLSTGPHSLIKLQQQIPDARLLAVLAELIDEQLVQRRGKTYYL
jgi:A/G-specific adenine glycosylase